MKELSFQDFVKEVLKRAEYKKGKDGDCIIAIASDLPGCMTQGDNFEEARENLIDAIELWITSALRDGETIPTVKGHTLFMARTKPSVAGRKVAYA
ncbi:MAG: type II toxin-antitoxin system HicB family antitoxin [Ignavibacteriales bacterium]|nr:type II toxin-antitoxin system HicB family antitoxin [Ignavibacteriales bacterium]